MDSLIRFALNNRMVVCAAALFLMVYGLWVGTILPVDVFPDLSAPTVTVVTEAGGRVSDIHGKPLDWTGGTRLYNNRGVLMTNRYLHDDILRAIARTGME